jgi:hypothetical protein
LSLRVRTGGLLGAWLAGCTQQAVPQHFASSVPQQHVGRELSIEDVPHWGAIAETGVQTAAPLVLKASKATISARIGFGVWGMAFVLRQRTLQGSLNPTIVGLRKQ